jgi:predicted butyrate kinase (DUF1464 family)
MVKVAGIDPGTKSMDICVLENGNLIFEKVIDTVEVAKRPLLLLDTLEELMPFDLIVGPSGYGVEVTFLKDIPSEKLEDWYYQYVLLTNKRSIEEAVKNGVFGAMVYYAMTRSALEMKKRNWPVCYIPGIIHLPTVPIHRKVNNLDMGTADKMCAAVLAVYDQSRRLRIPYSDVSFIQVEMGFGYNCIMGVDNGRIIDGIGGTMMGGPGFLTVGRMDAELVQLIGNWDKSDVFLGGCMSISGKSSPEELSEFVNGNEDENNIAWNAMIESVIKSVLSMTHCVHNPKEILLSGRLTRIEKIKDALIDALYDIAPVRRMGELENSKNIKETAQGYGIVADGIAGGKFNNLISWMEIEKSKGSAMDYIFHPKFQALKERLISFR